MKIGHIGLYTNRIEELREFYCKYFDGVSSEKYVNPAKGFQSYFIDFGEGTLLEIMSSVNVTANMDESRIGLAHIAFQFEERDEVVSMTDRFRRDGHIIAGEPRITGDGMFESVIKDPDGNPIELVAE